MGDFWGIVWLFVLLAGNAYFVAAEFAVISAKRSQIEPMAERGSKAAQTSLYAMEHATLMLAACQLGITICSLVILNVSEPAIHHLLAIPLEAMGLSVQTVTIASFVITLTLVTFLHVVLGEMVPKNLAFSVPDRAVLILAPPLVLFSKIMNPVIWTLNGIANVSLRAVGVTPKAEATSAFTFDEVAGIVEQSTKEGVLADEAGTLANTFEFTNKQVGEVAVPIDQVRILPAVVTTADVQAAVAEFGYSRYLLANEAGVPVGYIHLKDLLAVPDTEADRAVPERYIRPLTSLYEGTELEDALATMRRTGKHLARVFAKDGTSTGILFLEDIIEVLVGEVRDATARR